MKKFLMFILTIVSIATITTSDKEWEYGDCEQCTRCGQVVTIVDNYGHINGCQAYDADGNFICNNCYEELTQPIIICGHWSEG